MTAPSDISFEWIDSAAALRPFLDDAMTHDWYCVDTEFHREKTYFPQLALVQIAVGSRIALVDPVAVDPRLLAPLFEGPTTCVLHAAQQDLDVLRQVCGFVPSRIIDTQLCAGFIGYTQPSLSSLAQSLLKVTLPKGDRLSDWLRRPLSNDQMKYAASDVAYLQQIARMILDDLDRRGRREWATEACEELRVREFGPASPEDAWLKVKDVRTLRGRARWVAREVARWREERAMAQDLPPRHVLSDIAVLGVAQKAPRTVDDLADVRGVDGRHARGRTGESLLDAVSQGVAASKAGDLAFPVSDGDDLDKSMRPAVTLVSAWVTELARRSDLDAGLLGTRRDIVDLLSGSPSARLRSGWRAEIVGRDVEDLVAGRKALTFGEFDDGRGLRMVQVTSGDD